MNPTNDEVYQSDGQGLRTLEAVENSVRYNSWLGSKIIPWLGRHNLELGAGAGTITEIVKGHGSTDLVEASSVLRTELGKRFFNDSNIRILPNNFLEVSGQYDCIYSSNVIEHIPNYLDFISHSAKILRPGGHFVAIVPAHTWLMSDFDRSIGHLRRYGNKELSELREHILSENLPLEIVRSRYFNPVGALGWLVKMRLMKQLEIQSSDIRMNEFIMPALKLLDVLNVGFGQSLLLVLRRKK